MHQVALKLVKLIFLSINKLKILIIIILIIIKSTFRREIQQTFLILKQIIKDNQFPLLNKNKHNKKAYFKEKSV